MTGVLVKRGNLQTDTHTRTPHHVKIKPEIRVMFLQCQRTVRKPKEVSVKAQNRFFLTAQPSKRTYTADTLIFNF